ncbi:MAG TPA: hypothetical protein PKV16_08335 [Caldisericia bacterium]|nr:hypothetical protein [Caldisericia bacterium]HPF49784.1 hypothetical protein [Caldisericia bacterium]HPI84345.1 hypothetical protein [Caldisericia bacterium]HPQ93772.1 hypothetical protein [Caldisericia bacterium]HRV74804.1 hypothetical protein [Caldisericia bacterium]
MLQEELVAEFIATEDKRVEASGLVTKAEQDAATIYNEAIMMEKRLFDRIQSEIVKTGGAETEDTKYLHSLCSGACRGLYLSYKAIGKLTLSEMYFKLFEEHSLKSDYDYVLGFYHQELARRQMKQSRKDEAIQNYKKSIDHFIKSGQTDEIPELVHEQALLYVAAKNFDFAEDVYDETKRVLKEHDLTDCLNSLEDGQMAIIEEKKDWAENSYLLD